MPKSRPPPRAPKVSTDFFDVFAFSGSAPERINGILAFSGPAPERIKGRLAMDGFVERINGRLAMVGFVAAHAVELSKGEGVLTQLSDRGVPFFIGTVGSNSGGFMSSDAELWNGRFAMLGLVALAFTEYVTGGALV